MIVWLRETSAMARILKLLNFASFARSNSPCCYCMWKISKIYAKDLSNSSRDIISFFHACCLAALKRSLMGTGLTVWNPISSFNRGRGVLLQVACPRYWNQVYYWCRVTDSILLVARLTGIGPISLLVPSATNACSIATYLKTVTGRGPNAPSTVAPYCCLIEPIY